MDNCQTVFRKRVLGRRGTISEVKSLTKYKQFFRFESPASGLTDRFCCTFAALEKINELYVQDTHVW